MAIIHGKWNLLNFLKILSKIANPQPVFMMRMQL